MQKIIYLEAAGTNVEADARKLIPGATGQKFIIEKVGLVDWDGITGHASNYVEIDLLHGTAVIASRDTDSAGDGTLTALTPEDMSAAVGTIVTAGDYLHLDVDKQGTGPAFNAQVLVGLRAVL